MGWKYLDFAACNCAISSRRIPISPGALVPIATVSFIKRIATANGHSLELVRNLLEAMKIEFGTLNPVTEEFLFVKLAPSQTQDKINQRLSKLVRAKVIMIKKKCIL